MRVVENKVITEPMWPGDDGLRVNHEAAEIRNVVIDFANIPLDGQDEALSCVQQPDAKIYNTVLKNVGKAFLNGAGDPDSLQGGTVYLENCVIRNFGRRGPEVQDGITLKMKRCLIENWGDPKYFTVRNFGAWAHHGGSIECEDCLFIQDKFFKGGIKNFFLDLINHIGQSFNYRSANLLDYILPGVCRGLTAGVKGKVSATNCYKNKWWIRLENSTNPMDEDEAEELYEELSKLG